MKKIGLLPRIIIAIILGIGIGMISPDWLTRLFLTFNYAFSQFLGFLIPLIIIGFVAPAIADIGNRAGKMLLVTTALAYGATLMAGVVSFAVSDTTFPLLITDVISMDTTQPGQTLTPYFKIDIPPLMSVMTALVTAFMIGLGIAYLKGNALRHGFDELRTIVAKTINLAIIPLLPLYIMGIFVDMTVAGQVGVILGTFFKVILIIFGIHIFILLLQFCIAGAISRRNPLKMLWQMMPAYFTALGTQSSAATIPVTLKQTISLGVNPDIAGFTVPLCATIHMSGSTLKIVACALAIMVMQGMPYNIGIFMHFIALLGITIIAAPGIPGGAIMASLGLLSSILGFTDAQNAMMIALYIAMDSFGTACNVTGDGALSVIVNRIFRGKPQGSLQSGKA